VIVQGIGHDQQVSLMKGFRNQTGFADYFNGRRANSRDLLHAIRSNDAQQGSRRAAELSRKTSEIIKEHIRLD
jgi:hypothetical protein